MTIVSDGNRSAVKLNLPTIGAISSMIGVIVFISGWVLGYLTFKADLQNLAYSLTEVQTRLNGDQARMNTMQSALVDERMALSTRMTIIEGDIKYISQGISELKLRSATNRP